MLQAALACLAVLIAVPMPVRPRCSRASVPIPCTVAHPIRPALVFHDCSATAFAIKPSTFAWEAAFIRRSERDQTGNRTFRPAMMCHRECLHWKGTLRCLSPQGDRRFARGFFWAGDRQSNMRWICTHVKRRCSRKAPKSGKADVSAVSGSQYHPLLEAFWQACFTQQGISAWV